eukprot:GHVT01104370.1.p1 GENE.GHVT01104370.1~~GHVT01104370.1.p1  ORF type:complete len:146 (-),score=1.95 GHVT01104370.1:1604-2041(-)
MKSGGFQDSRGIFKFHTEIPATTFGLNGLTDVEIFPNPFVFGISGREEKFRYPAPPRKEISDNSLPLLVSDENIYCLPKLHGPPVSIGTLLVCALLFGRIIIKEWPSLLFWLVLSHLCLMYINGSAFVSALGMCWAFCPFKCTSF